MEICNQFISNPIIIRKRKDGKVHSYIYNRNNREYYKKIPVITREYSSNNAII